MNRILWFGCSMFLVLVLIAAFGSILPFVDVQLEKEVVRMEEGKIESPPYPPSSKNILGSDQNGRDLLSLIIIGTKDTLFFVFAIALIRYLIAIPLALLATDLKGPFHWLVNGWNQLFSGLPALFSVIILLNFPFLIFIENRT